MESPKRRIETREIEVYSTKASKMPKLDAPPPLPEGAWAEWGEDAVCFVLPISGEEGFGIFAINPCDSSVYHIVDFRSSPGVASNAACAVLGSRVYVVSDTGSMWFCDIDGLEWKKGKNLNGIPYGNPNPKLFNSPTMFTLNDNLYVVDLVINYDQASLPPHKFQKLFKKGWLSLRSPPPIRPSLSDNLSEYCREFLGIVCTENSVIFHVCTTHRHLKPFPGFKASCSCGVFHEHRFLCYKPNDGHGEWINIGGYAERISPRQNPLLLLMPPEKICNFGPHPSTEMFIDLDELDDELCLRTWSLFHVTGRIFCAVAFPPPATSEPADFIVYTFGIIDHEVPEDLKLEDVDAVVMTARLISLSHQRFSGFMVPKGPPQEDEFSLQNHSQELSS